jgi:hypothetical protein
VHHFTPQTKQAELQWKHAIPRTAKKSKVCQSAGGVYISILSNTECDHFVLFSSQLQVQPATPMPTLQQRLYTVHLTFKIKHPHTQFQTNSLPPHLTTALNAGNYAYCSSAKSTFTHMQTSTLHSL